MSEDEKKDPVRSFFYELIFFVISVSLVVYLVDAIITWGLALGFGMIIIYICIILVFGILGLFLGMILFEDIYTFFHTLYVEERQKRLKSKKRMTVNEINEVLPPPSKSRSRRS